ncbi:MAG: RNA recognition motif domain-containing protein [Dissulfurispiraceae bacterium]
MGKKIYVGNISFSSTEGDLRELFAQFGEVESVKIITDAQTGRAKGFGFIEMSTEEEAKKAIGTLNGTVFKERSLSVSEAKPQQPRDRGSFGRRGDFGGGRGGFGGGGRGTGRGRR